MGVRWVSLGQARALSRALALHLREELQDSDAGHPRRARFPRARRPGPGHVHLPPAPGGSKPVCLVSRRGALDRQAPEPYRLVARGESLARTVPEVNIE